MSIRASTIRLVVAGGLLACGVTAQATPFVLQDQNSTAAYETQTQDGQHSWIVDGVSHLNKQWFWYRTDAMPGESSIDALTQVGAVVTDTNPFTDSRPDTLAVLYADPGQQFQIELGLRLRGATFGSGSADIAEQISIRNLTGSPLGFHFFQYVDFDLNGNPQGDLTAFLADNTVEQRKFGGSAVTETVITSRSDHHETQLVPITLNRLNDAMPTTLDDSNAAGPANVAWAFEWDVNIPGFGEFLISKDKQITPEPATLSLLALGGLVALRRKR